MLEKHCPLKMLKAQRDHPVNMVPLPAIALHVAMEKNSCYGRSDH
jgi:hypothetical protein